jgi:hypothetical protein
MAQPLVPVAKAPDGPAIVPKPAEGSQAGKPVEVIDFDSLEAEMSRLLGRDPSPRG